MTGGGVYTVIRCDYNILNNNDSVSNATWTWRIWGKEFHFNRLQESYAALLPTKTKTTTTNKINATIDMTNNIMNGLLTEAEAVIRKRFYNEKNIDTMMYVVVMLTVLWIPPSPSKSDENNINVKGHVFSTMKPVYQQTIKNDKTYNRNPNLPVNVMVGYLPSSKANDDTETTNDNHQLRLQQQIQQQQQQQLPNRYEYVPQAKTSSWCRRRRPLEDLFKNNVIGNDIISEIILTKIVDNDDEEEREGSIELLEGLTSNLFVVCENNTIRTPSTTDVLGGYIRQLIIESAASRLGYAIEIGPIYTKDAPLWKEVFLTSSIRLVIPIELVLIPTKVGDDGSSIIQSSMLWESSPLPRSCSKDDDSLHTTTACDVLYEYLMSETFDH